MSEGAVGDLGISGIVDAVKIGEGGAATVYRARQQHLDRTVAVKVIHSARNDATLRRFRREASALGTLSDHPGIVSVYDAGMTDATHQPYLVMQLCEQGSLDDLLNDAGVMDGAEACRLLAPVAETLAHAHDESIVHRDMKPANLLVGKDGELLVADFGIASLQDATTGVSTAISFSPGYVPPETLEGASPDTPGDVYSLGATLYSMTTGAAPYSDGGQSMNVMETVARMASGQMVPPVDHGVDAGTAAVIEAAMARNPSDRPSMRELARLLRAEAASGPPGSAPPTRILNEPIVEPPSVGPPIVEAPSSGANDAVQANAGPTPGARGNGRFVVGALVALAVIAAVIGGVALGRSGDPSGPEVAADSPTPRPEPTERPEATATPEPAASAALVATAVPAPTRAPSATAAPVATEVAIFGSADCTNGSDPLFAGRSIGPGQSDTGTPQSEIRIAVCTSGSGAVEYFGLTLDDGLSIRLNACQSTAGVWQASNNGWIYTVIDQSSSADERGVLRLVSPAGTLLTWSIGLDVIRNPILNDQARSC